MATSPRSRSARYIVDLSPLAWLCAPAINLQGFAYEAFQGRRLMSCCHHQHAVYMHQCKTFRLHKTSCAWKSALGVAARHEMRCHDESSGRFVINQQSCEASEYLWVPAERCARHDEECYSYLGGRGSASHHHWGEWRLCASRGTQEYTVHLAGQAVWQGDHDRCAPRQASSLTLVISLIIQGRRTCL